MMGGRPISSCLPVIPANTFEGVWPGRDTGEAYRAFFETRATNSSNLERKSFRMGDRFDFL